MIDQHTADQIEQWFTDGKLAGELELRECPHPEGSLARHWWTRGSAYSARLLRAIRAEMGDRVP